MMDLTTPDAYTGNAYGWITNQSGHALIIGAMLFAPLALLIGRLWAFVALAVGYAGWEVWQGGGLGDGFADWGFVLLGAGWVWAAWDRQRVAAAALWVMLAAGFAVGVWRRK